ncbi:ATP-binding protein [Rhodococcus qingshengii]|uniref:ATP-binding protein n=1 Tax=Rhodococcus TaxID=1827 RepID=UPI001BAB31AC|nr:ATP-binding protein [Rhodococcus qingshengii]MBS3693078.1 ATP-binding protein [Rhodococcus qingshengii]
MTTTPTKDTAASESGPADIIQIDTALESMRDSGFDLTAASGEPIDNSIEAGANVMRVESRYGEGKKSIEELAFADDGDGIKPEIMARALSLGFSTRYGQRGGLGRFGVGMKLAGLSLGRRIDIYTKRRGNDQIWHSYLDLDEVKGGTQVSIEAQPVDAWPPHFAALMTDPAGESFGSGTLVVFGKIDRLTSGGHFGTSLDQKLADLRTFIARAYRSYLDKGMIIELNGKHVTLLDPLFLMDNPRIIKRYKPATVRGEVVDEGDIEIVDGHSIHVTVSLAPAEFRCRAGDGGHIDHRGRDIREFDLPDSAGKISMVRNGREINYGIVPRLLPAGIEKVDRYVGIEIRFPAELDEFFQVRNVKHGAVPVDKLRSELREWLNRPVRRARKKIREHWGDVETQERAAAGAHDAATDTVATVDKTSPRGQAGHDVTEEQAEQVFMDLVEDLQLNQAEKTEAIDQIREQVKAKPITMVDAAWPGSEMFDIEHLNGKAIVKINQRHPLWRDVFLPIRRVALEGMNGTSEEELIALIRRADKAMDLLVLAYAKAENLNPNPSIFDELRSDWGKFTKAYLTEAIKED